ncbi:MAG: serine/threonine protein kinase [Pedosphaera sp.]|nr:serine/threonine protein kinase [Pedosphaera sp.]
MKSSKCSVIMAAVAASIFSAHAAHWPSWRGPAGDGVSLEKNLPAKWSATENVRWKIALPARGNSTPAVWGERVFVTQAMDNEQRRTLMCFDRRDGRLLWQQGVDYAALEKTHPDNPPCSGSPATDGERVIVCHASAGVFCYDFAGKELWRRDLGKLDFEFGPGTSPFIHGDIMFLYRGPDAKAFLIALDKRTGKTIWKNDDPPVITNGRTDGFRGQKGLISSYSMPILVKSGVREELVMSFPGTVQAFDPKSGRSLWTCGGLNPLVYTSPIAGAGVVVAMGGYFGNTIAVSAGGAGDVTAKRLWQTVCTKNRLGSGVVAGDHVYILNTDGIAECIELKTGKVAWLERLQGKGAKQESWSSMVLAGDSIYILNQSAETYVLRASPKFEQLAANPLDGALCNASHAVSDGEIFIRTHTHLWCIGKQKTAASVR